jgi:hypothetical protein
MAKLMEMMQNRWDYWLTHLMWITNIDNKNLLFFCLIISKFI